MSLCMVYLRYLLFLVVIVSVFTVYSYVFISVDLMLFFSCGYGICLSCVFAYVLPVSLVDPVCVFQFVR